MPTFNYIDTNLTKKFTESVKNARKQINLKKDQAVIMKSKFKPVKNVETIQAVNPTPDAVIGTPSPSVSTTPEVNMVGGAEFQAAPAELAPTNTPEEMINPFDIAAQMTTPIEETPALSVEIPTNNVQPEVAPIVKTEAKPADPVISVVENNATSVNNLANTANVLSEEEFIVELRKLLDISPIKYQVLKEKLEIEAKLVLNDQKYLDQVERGKAEVGEVGRDLVGLAQANQQMMANQNITKAPETLEAGETLTLQQAA